MFVQLIISTFHSLLPPELCITHPCQHSAFPNPPCVAGPGSVLPAAPRCSPAPCTAQLLQEHTRGCSSDMARSHKAASYLKHCTLTGSKVCSVCVGYFFFSVQLPYLNAQNKWNLVTSKGCRSPCYLQAMPEQQPAEAEGDMMEVRFLPRRWRLEQHSDVCALASSTNWSKRL